MSEQEFEERLAQVALPEPPAGMRERLVGRARRERRWRAVERVWSWTLAAAAMLLLVLNLHFGRVHEQQMIALVGLPAIERPLKMETLACQFQQRQRLLMTISTADPGNGLKEGWLQ